MPHAGNVDCRFRNERWLGFVAGTARITKIAIVPNTSALVMRACNVRERSEYGNNAATMLEVFPQDLSVGPELRLGLNFGKIISAAFFELQ